MSTDKNMQRLLKGAEDKIINEWSRPAFEKLGSRLQRALLAEAVLSLLAVQDDSVRGETIRKIIDEGWAWAINQSGY